MRTLIATAAAALLIAGTAFAQTPTGSSKSSPSTSGTSSGTSSEMSNGSSSSGSSRHYKRNPEQSQVPSDSSKTRHSTTTKPGNNDMSGSGSNMSGPSRDMGSRTGH